MKKHSKMITTMILAAAIAISQLSSICALAAPYGKVDGTYRMIDGTAINGVVARGIDISHWQGVIDWGKVSGDDVEFAMLGTRYSGKVDPNFHTNATNAVNSGVKIGAYIYSYATDTQMALQEADFILDLIKDYPISYPVAFDIEANVQSTLSPQEVSTIINVFCQRIEEAGYYPMLYANDYWLANKIDMSQVKYDVWVARYEAKHVFQNPVMWQATSTGSISGINGNVDIDFQYKDFAPSIPANRWRTIAGKTYYYKNFQMQKDAWINDDNGWYYMNQEGSPSKGWLTLSDKSYYLNDTSGKMETSWKQLNQSWYYFNPAGDMAKGWINDNGTMYYTDGDGKMQNGWLKQNEDYYYLRSSGAMATSWRQVDNQWYYFNPTGIMSKGWINDNGTWYFANHDGQMQSGWLKQNDTSYYLKPSGAMTTGWRSVDNQWYYFNSAGTMSKGWINDNGTWYFTDNNGMMQNGWLSDKNNWYYLDASSGAMAANTTLQIDGTSYSVDGSGICQPIETAVNEPTGEPISIPSNPETQPVAIGPGIS